MLNLYRRHRNTCKGGHPAESRSGEFEERKKGWKTCSCIIFASGTLNRTFDRKGTGKSTWVEAKDIVAQWEKTNSWDLRPVTAPPTPTGTHGIPGHLTAVNRKPIPEAIASYLADFEKSADSTRKNYRLLLKNLQAFSDRRGYVMIDQWKTEDVRDFRASWPVKQRTANKKMSTVRAFFRVCEDNDWVSHTPAKKVRNYRNRDAADTRNEQKSPFSDRELAIMYETCKSKYGKQHILWARGTHHKRAENDDARYNRKWTGEDLADFISLSVSTGLRISDVATFRSDRLKPNGEVHVKTMKGGKKVYVWVAKEIQDMIQARAQKHGVFIFGEHRTKKMDSITNGWRDRLIDLWKLCGPLANPDEEADPQKFSWERKPTPHRFRHTFARILLQTPGVGVSDVADAMGDTEQMVRKHYAEWVPERQERLTNVLKEAFAKKPKPKLVVIAGNRAHRS